MALNVSRSVSPTSALAPSGNFLENSGGFEIDIIKAQRLAGKLVEEILAMDVQIGRVAKNGNWTIK